MTVPKHVALLKNKKDCADVYCVVLIEFEKHFPIPFTHNSCPFSPDGQRLSTRQLKKCACIDKANFKSTYILDTYFLIITFVTMQKVGRDRISLRAGRSGNQTPV